MRHSFVSEIYIAKKRGMNVLADIGDFDDYPNTAVIVTRAFVETHRSLAKNLLKSKSNRFIISGTTNGKFENLEKIFEDRRCRSGRCDLRVFRRRMDPMPRAVSTVSKHP